MSEDLAGARGDEQAFVRRCRIVSTGVLRLGALVVTVRGVNAVVGTLVDLSGIQGFGGRGRVEWMGLAIVGLTLLSGVALWFAAGWVSRLAFRMPAGRNQCPKCKYPLEGLAGGKCPECGTRVK